ncbi:MAG: hypothetical protein IJO76_03030 [Clostridia bacterium]|nr:hypothetical protein [Clostridia bacterium]
MKKGKELLWFLLPFVLLNVWSIVGPVLMIWTSGDPLPQFVGVGHYLYLMLNDPLVLQVTVSTLLGSWLAAAVLGAALGGLVLLLRRWIPLFRTWWYVAIFALAALTMLGIWVAQMRLFPSFNNWTYFLQTGNIAAFFVWLVELIWTAVKKPKQEVETE